MPSNEHPRWGLYPWFPEHGEEYVHPEDVNAFRLLFPYGKAFAVLAEEDSYVVLQYGNARFRVKPDLLKPISAPANSFGEKVRVVSHGEDVTGTVSDIQWHFERAEPYYLLMINGKRSKKRYWKVDFLDV
jgi:hypothetical protein